MDKQLTVTPVDTRASDRVAFIAACIVMGVILAAVLGLFSRPLPRQASELFFGPAKVSRDILALRPSPTGGAFLVWRERGSQWIGRVGLLGIVWARQIKGEAQYIGDQGLAVDENRVVLRYSRWGGRALAVMSLAESSGQVQWDVDFKTYEEGEYAHDHVHDDDGHHVNLLVARDVVLVWRTGEMVTLDARTGRGVSVDRFEELHSFRNRPAGITMQNNDGDTYRWGPTGPRVVKPGNASERRSVTCVVQGKLLRVGGRYDEPFVIEDLDDDAVARKRLNVGVSDLFPRSCGDYDGKLVLFGSTRLHDEQLRVLVFNGDGDVERRFDVEEIPNYASRDGEFPDATALSGSLSRFVPYVGHTSNGSRLVMLDLATGTVAWKSREGMSSGLTQVFTAHGAWYVDLNRKVIARFDGATGQLTRAVDTGSSRDLTRACLQAGLLWIRDWHGADGELSISVLDADTLDWIELGGSRVEDVTAETNERLGLP